jgi:hypothetical protein
MYPSVFHHFNPQTTQKNWSAVAQPGKLLADELAFRTRLMDLALNLLQLNAVPRSLFEGFVRETQLAIAYAQNVPELDSRLLDGYRNALVEVATLTNVVLTPPATNAARDTLADLKLANFAQQLSELLRINIVEIREKLRPESFGDLLNRFARMANQLELLLNNIDPTVKPSAAFPSKAVPVAVEGAQQQQPTTRPRR